MQERTKVNRAVHNLICDAKKSYVILAAMNLYEDIYSSSFSLKENCICRINIDIFIRTVEYSWSN